MIIEENPVMPVSRRRDTGSIISYECNSLKNETSKQSVNCGSPKKAKIGSSAQLTASHTLGSD